MTLANGAVLETNSFAVRTNSDTASATISGAGQFQVSGTLTQNGRFVGDGGTLDVDFATLAQNASRTATQGDGTQAGWFATSTSGALVLDPLTITGDTNRGDTGDTNWGEETGDTTLDLVNSLRFTSFQDLTSGGTLDVSLLSNTNTAVTTGLTNALGVWNLNTDTVAFSSVTTTIRFDDALAAALGVAESGLKVFQASGGCDQTGAWISGVFR